MKRAFFILLFFSNLIAFCQESYHFDYMVTDREETDIAVLFVGRQDVKDCCHVGFIERQLANWCICLQTHWEVIQMISMRELMKFSL